MMYLLTPEVHAQIVDALTNDGTHEDDCPYSNDCFNDDCDHCAPIRDMRTTLALAMLKAMKPSVPVGFAYQHQDYIGSVIGAAGEWAPNEIPLYAKG